MLVYKPQPRPLLQRPRAAMTDAEHRPWFRLRRKQLLGVQFYRQKPTGKYIVDFYAPAVASVIAVVGGQHFEASQANTYGRCTACLEAKNLRVLQFTDREVLRQLDAVVDAVFAAVSAASGKPWQVGKPLRAVDRALRAIKTKAGKLVRRGKLSGDFGQMIKRLLDERRQLVAGLAT
jgi:very-short-patch-repair endonuclease